MPIKLFFKLRQTTIKVKVIGKHFYLQINTSKNQILDPNIFILKDLKSVWHLDSKYLS